VRPSDPTSAAQQHFDERDLVVVVTETNVVLGAITSGELTDEDGDASCEKVMRPGPSTYRPDVPASELAAKLSEKGEPFALITTNDGVLVGVAPATELERIAAFEGKE